jgi:uncharacterized protein YdeI (YjbR/CyaY-like superfamily)
MNPQIDQYLINGCMRCKYGGTPACKVHRWQEELNLLRQLVLESGLQEELKWSIPCYTYAGKNVATVSAFKDYACLSFFKGSLLTDPLQLLHKPGERSQAARTLKFTSPAQVAAQAVAIRTFLAEAIELEKAGRQVVFAKNPEPLPAELLAQLEESTELKKAFFSLSPGQQRAYIIYFSQPKQTQTRLGRIEKYRQQILEGKPFFDKKKREET